MTEHTFNGLIAKPLTVVNNFQKQLLPWGSDQGYRVIGQLYGLEIFYTQAGVALLESIVHRVIFKYQNAFKQRQISRNLTPALDFDQGTVLELAQLQLLRL